MWRMKEIVSEGVPRGLWLHANEYELSAITCMLPETFRYSMILCCATVRMGVEGVLWGKGRFLDVSEMLACLMPFDNKVACEQGQY